MWINDAAASCGLPSFFFRASGKNLTKMTS